MLHLVFGSPLSATLFARTVQNDAVLFLENAVFNLSQRGQFNTLLTDWQKRCALYVLIDELLIRGIDTTDLVTGIKPITYEQFVELTINHTPIASWN